MRFPICAWKFENYWSASQAMGITTHSAGSLVWRVASWPEHRHSICRLLLHPYRLPHLQVDVPASNSGRANGVCRFGLAAFLAPPLANFLSPYILVLGFLAELALMLWLLVMGVNVQRWKDRAIAVGASRLPV